PRADWTDESLGGHAERSLLARRHALRDVDGLPTVRSLRSDGMDPLPHRATARATGRSRARDSLDALRDRPQAAGEERGRPLPARARRRGRLAAMPGPMGGHRWLRAVRACRARRAGPIADPRAAIRPRA